MITDPRFTDQTEKTIVAEKDGVRVFIPAIRGNRDYEEILRAGLTISPSGTVTENLEAYAAEKRFAKETGGITINGIQVRTDRESQALITGAYNLALRDGGLSIKFKAANGFVELSASSVIGVAVLVAQHVQACFAAEADCVEAIRAGRVRTKSQVDAYFE